VGAAAAWARQHGVAYVGLDELFRRSLGVTIHLPYDDTTEDMVDERLLRLMPKGAFLLNTCRGEVLDEDALHRCLLDGQLGGAALDVYRQEPYLGPLRALPNVFLCCHQGSCSHDGRYAMEMGAAENTVAWQRGEPLQPERVVWVPRS
jgi:phosphoglycerate dehydrogenase-like enzyme